MAAFLTDRECFYDYVATICIPFLYVEYWKIILFQRPLGHPAPFKTNFELTIKTVEAIPCFNIFIFFWCKKKKVRLETTERHCVKDTSGKFKRHCVKDTSGKIKRPCVKDTLGKIERHSVKDTSGKIKRHCIKDTSGKIKRHCIKDTSGKTKRHCVKNTLGKIDGRLEYTQRILSKSY